LEEGLRERRKVEGTRRKKEIKTFPGIICTWHDQRFF
jgi:hypothetical protein